MQSAVVKSSLEVEVKIKVADMSCGGCANAIQRAIHALDPQAKVKAELPVRIVHIDSAETPERLIETIHAAGFHASLKG